MRISGFRVSAVVACLFHGVVWAETTFICPESTRLQSAVVAPAALPEGFSFAALQGLI